MAYITFCVYFTMLSPKSICTTINYKNKNFLLNQLYQEKYNKYLCYFWFQGLVVPKVAKSLSKFGFNIFLCITTNQNLKFTLIAYT